MIEFKMDNENYWCYCEAQNFSIFPEFENYIMRINGDVYSRNTKDFRDAFKKELLWETLQHD